TCKNADRATHRLRSMMVPSCLGGSLPVRNMHPTGQGVRRAGQGTRRTDPANASRVAIDTCSVRICLTFRTF
ncbi:MAG: hypothetical protein KDE01_11635, partial [Caldilineaceae bacterium]|nr:hypothetical protein [Caldilineaceae bacterium]